MSAGPRDTGDDGSVDVEAAWADIVARWDDEQPPVGRWPASEDAETVAGDDPPAVEPGDGAPPADLTPEDDADDGVADDWAAPSHVGGERVREAAAAPEPVEDDEGYVPPEPPPLPRGDLVSTLAWIGVLGTPIFFLATALFWRTVPQLLIVAAIAAFVGGFVTLVVRMPEDRDGDGWDDGAVV